MESITDYFSLPHISLPVQNPALVFFIVLAIILFAPLLFNKLRIPHLVGLIIAGAIIGENGLNILQRDESFKLFGQVGIFYIMFLAGLEMDIGSIKENRVSGLTFGLLTAIIPFGLGFLAGISLLHYTLSASLLLACIFASHTLVAYPIAARYGITRQRSVQISVVGTMIALLLSLMVLAGIAGDFKGEGGMRFWMLFVLKFAVYLTVLFFFFPRCIRFFFKKVSDPVLQYSFVLAMVFLSATSADLCGLEGILGAFLAGLIFGHYIPQSSPLMSRLEFVGNALFIPFFLIGVGMLVNVHPLFESMNPVIVVSVMVIVGTLTKWLAAVCTRMLLKMKRPEGLMMFGLSEAHAAGALAMVMVGTNLVNHDGNPLMSSDVLDGVVVMILISCIISSICTEQASKQLKLMSDKKQLEEQKQGDDEKILIPINNQNNIYSLVHTGIAMRNAKLNRGLIFLNIINDGLSDEKEKEKVAHSKACLAEAGKICTESNNVSFQTQSRYAVDFPSATAHAFRENDASEIIIGLHEKQTPSDSLLGDYMKKLTDLIKHQIIAVHYTTVYSAIRRIVVAIPDQAEAETGFLRWVERVARLANDIKCEIKFYGSESTTRHIEYYMQRKHKTAQYECKLFHMKNGIDMLAGEVNPDHLLVIVSARHGSMSYLSNINKLNVSIKRHFSSNSLMIIFPDQNANEKEGNKRSFADPLDQDNYHSSVITNWLSKWVGKMG
jgi:Kef-type K+ transport system membrane component KefB